VFNFGLHDTNDEAADEEARDEFVPASEYVHSPLFVSICPSLLIYIVDERECERQSTTVCEFALTNASVYLHSPLFVNSIERQCEHRSFDGAMPTR
jgi:hypothetical protein